MVFRRFVSPVILLCAALNSHDTIAQTFTYSYSNLLDGVIQREAGFTEFEMLRAVEESLALWSSVGARTEVPGCSLCMGNQARVADNATVLSTSTRNFPNRLGNGANVFLASAELSAITATLGYIPTVEEYMQHMKSFETMSDSIYRYLNFDQLPEYSEVAEGVRVELA